MRNAVPGALLATASPLYGDGGVPDLAPRLVEGEVTEQPCGLRPLEFVLFVPSPVSLGGEISGGCLGRYVIGRLSVFLLVAVREVGSGRAYLGRGSVRDPLHGSDYPFGCRSQPIPELGEAGSHAAEQAWLGPCADLFDDSQILGEGANY